MIGTRWYPKSAMIFKDTTELTAEMHETLLMMECMNDQLVILPLTALFFQVMDGFRDATGAVG